MGSETLSEEEKNAYRALNLFIRSYAFYETTMEMGDIPCSEALKGEGDGIFSPKYDTQEEVFLTILICVSLPDYLPVLQPLREILYIMEILCCGGRM